MNNKIKTEEELYLNTALHVHTKGLLFSIYKKVAASAYRSRSATGGIPT